MKTKFFFVFFFFIEIHFSEPQTHSLPYNCDCENIYDLKTGNLSVKSIIPFQVYLFLKTKESNITVLKKLSHAVVINEDWLLSTGKYFKNFDHQKNRIFVGLSFMKNKEVNSENIKEKSFLYTVEKIFTFPNYSDTNKLDDNLFFNFALLKLKISFMESIFMKKIKPACILNTKISEKKRSYFVVGDSSFKSTCYQSATYLKKENLYYSSYEEHNFMMKHCHENKVLCFNSENLGTCLQDLGTPLYVEKGSKIYVVGMHIGRDFLENKEFFYSNCSQSNTNYFSYFHYVFPWIENTVGKKICKFDEVDEKKTTFKQKIKKLSKIKEKCECEYKELFDYIGNKSFFEPKKYTKRFNSPKKYFRHLVQIVKHNMYDVLDPYRFICTGVVINENFVITTAECANKTELNNLYIYFGLRSLEGIEKIDSFFTSYTSKVLEQIFHPFHIPDSGMFYNDLQILRTKLPIEERPNLLSPACFANEKELEKQADDKLLISSFMLLGNFQNRVIDLNRKSNIEFIISKYITDYYHQGVDQCGSLICVPTPIYADLGTEGTPLHRFTEYSMEVSGLMKKNVLPVFYKLHRFVPLTKNMKWIKLVVGQFDYCERNEVNRFFSKKICKCDYSVSNLLESNPFIVSIIGYKDKTTNSKTIVCKSVIINEFWVLTTNACFNKTSFKSEYYFLSLHNKEIGKHTITEFSELELTGFLYPVKKIVFNDKSDLTLVKSKEKMLLGGYSNKYAGCFYRKEREVDLSKSLLLESFVQNVQAKYEPKCNCVSFNSEICFENEGTPISLIDDWFESAIVGVLNVHSIIDYTANDNCSYFIQKPDNFFPIQKSIKWLNEVVGENNYCHLENHFFDPRACRCQDQNIVSIVRDFLFEQVKYYQYFCRGIVVNDYWILTTASCVFRKKGLKVNINSDNDTFFSYTIDPENTDKFIKLINYIYINPNYEETQNRFGFFNGLEYNSALIRLQKPLGLLDKPDLEASCFTEEKKYSRNEELFSRLHSQNNFIIPWYEFKARDFIDENYTQNPNVLSLYSQQVVCNSDQGEPIRKKMELGIMTLALMSYQDDRYSVTYQKNCFRGYINIGIKINVVDPWFKDKVEAHGICIYEKYDEFKITNRCDCDMEGKIEDNRIRKRIFNGTKIDKNRNYFKYMAFLTILTPSDLFDYIPFYNNLDRRNYTFLSSAFFITPSYLLTSKKNSLLTKINVDDNFLLVGLSILDPNNNGRTFIGNNYIFLKVLKIRYFHDTQINLIEIPYYEPLVKKILNSNIKLPCLTLFDYKNFTSGKLLGVGFSHTIDYEVFDEEKKFLLRKKTSRLDNFLNTLEFTTNFTEVLKRNPKANLTCEDKFICVTSHGTISELDIGGPLLFMRGKIIEVVAVMTIEDNKIPEPYEIFKFTKLSHLMKSIKYWTYNEANCHAKKY